MAASRIENKFIVILLKRYMWFYVPYFTIYGSISFKKVSEEIVSEKITSCEVSPNGQYILLIFDHFVHILEVTVFPADGLRLREVTKIDFGFRIDEISVSPDNRFLFTKQSISWKNLIIWNFDELLALEHYVASLGSSDVKSIPGHLNKCLLGHQSNVVSAQFRVDHVNSSFVYFSNVLGCFQEDHSLRIWIENCVVEGHEKQTPFFRILLNFHASEGPICSWAWVPLYSKVAPLSIKKASLPTKYKANLLKSGKTNLSEENKSILVILDVNSP